MALPKIKISGKPTYVKFGQDVDFFELFRKIERQYNECFIFDSLGEEGKFSRYSIIGFAPTHTVSARGRSLIFDGKVHEVGNPYETLRAIMPSAGIAREYAGGLVGYIGYEATEYFEPSLVLKEHGDFDRFHFGVYMDGLVHDKQTGELFYFYYDKDRRPELEALIKESVSRSEERRVGKESR